MRRLPLVLCTIVLAGAAFLHGAPQAATPVKAEKSEVLGLVSTPKAENAETDEKPAVGAKTDLSIQTGDRLWSAVVYATNAPNPHDIPDELKTYERRLKRVFGYNEFKLLGTASSPIVDRAEAKITPGERFSLNYRARRANSKEARGGYLLSLQLFHDEKSIVDTETKLAPGSPLFIRGPQCGNGHLLIVLQVER